jgi:hypothetical protein
MTQGRSPSRPGSPVSGGPGARQPLAHGRGSHARAVAWDRLAVDTWRADVTGGDVGQWVLSDGRLRTRSSGERIGG